MAFSVLEKDTRKRKYRIIAVELTLHFTGTRI
jgi:hypothetical protein